MSKKILNLCAVVFAMFVFLNGMGSSAFSMLPEGKGAPGGQGLRGNYPMRGRLSVHAPQTSTNRADQKTLVSGPLEATQGTTASGLSASYGPQSDFSAGSSRGTPRVLGPTVRVSNQVNSPLPIVHLSPSPAISPGSSGNPSQNSDTPAGSSDGRNFGSGSGSSNVRLTSLYIPQVETLYDACLLDDSQEIKLKVRLNPNGEKGPARLLTFAPLTDDSSGTSATESKVPVELRVLMVAESHDGDRGIAFSVQPNGVADASSPVFTWQVSGETSEIVLRSKGDEGKSSTWQFQYSSAGRLVTHTYFVEGRKRIRIWDSRN